MLNHIALQGRFTRDPELRTTSNGVSVTSFTLAVERDYMRNGEDKADFIDCAAFRQTAEFVSKYFQRGQLAVVIGSLHARKYTDKTGANRTAWEVIADKVYFGGDKKAERETRGRTPDDVPNPVQVAFEDIDDADGELPF